MDPQCLIPGDTTLIDNIVNYLKAKGIFDEFRHECLADVDTKSSCQNLSQRVDGYTSKFLANETWHADLNKNELRNKLRRHIDESGMLAVGADHVVEQVINPKIHQLFLPKIIEVVHQYVKEQTELLNKKPETISSENTLSSEKIASDILENKDKTVISDPIADILSFSYTKAKSTPVTNTHVKTENVQQKNPELTKAEKKKEEKSIPVVEKNSIEAANENITSSVSNELKPQFDKEKDKIKKEEPETLQEVSKKVVKDEVKSEKKKIEDAKIPVSETIPVEESKANIATSIKHPMSKKDFNKHKQKLKSISQKFNTSNDIKKPKKELHDKSSEKSIKYKPLKSPKESSSPTKSSSSLKSVFKEEKGECSKLKSSDSNYGKTSESSQKKYKPVPDKKDSSSSKLKGYKDKTDKMKVLKSADKNEPNIHQDSSNSEKASKSIHYSSSYDSSQGSDQERSSSSNSKQERPKHFSKHAKKEKPEHPDNNNKTFLDKKRSKDDDESPSKKYKNEKDSKLKLKDLATIEAAKISSRSNSFGSTSSISSSSNASKDNMVSNSDEISENILKEKKKKPVKEKESCQNSPKLPPPPPPPPPSSSLSCELPSSTEMSSVEDTQSSSGNEASSNEDIDLESSSDSELESKDLIQNTLNESLLNSSSDNINAFYDIFLYSSSSSEFEGYGNSPEKRKMFEDALKYMHDSDISISSVHTSDLSSFDDELSSDDDVAFLTGGLKKRLSLKEAQELIQNRAILQDKCKNYNSEYKSEGTEVLSNKGCNQSASFLSSDDESSPSEPKRSLRRERKLNPRYTSSEYTSIFNCRKETFITKQTSPSVKSRSFNSVSSEPTHRKVDSLIENNKIPKKNLREIKKNVIHQDEIGKPEKIKNHSNANSQDELDGLSDCSKISSSDEINSIMDRGNFFQENDRIHASSDTDKPKLHLKLKPHNNSKLKRNSLSVKRKLEVSESTPVKRPCSRSSVDSSNSEFVPNENKPFNSEKQSFLEEKMLTDCNLKGPDLTVGIKKDVFCKQRTNNNGDILGQKDIFSKNSHGKAINNPEKKGSESDASKELNSL